MVRAGYEFINIRGTRVGKRVSIPGVKGDEYPGYEFINIRGTSGVRVYKYPWYKGG